MTGFRPACALLGVLGLVTAGVQLTAPGVATRTAPSLVALACGVATVVMARYARRLPGPSARPWWALVLAGALLAVGQSIAALPGAAGAPAQAGWADVPQLLAVVPAVAACLLLLPPRSGGRLGLRVLLDGLVVLVAVGVLAGLVLSDAVLRTDGPAGALVTVGYPAAGSVLCGVALITVIRVPDVRRRAAAWLLVTAVAMTVVSVADALGKVIGGTAPNVLAPVAWAGMLAAALSAADSDPGRPAEEPERPAGLPLLGFVVGSSVASGVALVVLVAFLAGRPVPATVSAGAAVLVLLVFARTLLWAADSGRMTRRLLRTEAYLRALVSSAEDVTVVLDGIGTVTWVSGAVRTQLGWTDAELTGRSLPELVHPDDRDVLARVSAATGCSVATGLAETVRLGTREGDWRDVEISGVARAGVPGTGLRDGLVLHLRDVTARRSDQRELERMAYTDYLTGLPNRARFMAALEVARARAAEGRPAGVLLVDLDGFKTVNDVAGHDAGDRLLCEVAELLRSGARDRDLVARLGGDEFALLVPGSADEATGLAERLVALLNRQFRVRAADGAGPGPVFPVSGSIGLAVLRPGDDVSATIRQADLALRAAKAAGKNRVRSSGDAVDSAMGRRTRLARDLPAALEQGQLRLEYQPVAGIAERRVLGVEALVRWDHPLLGTVPPDEFIGLAEEDGLIVPLQRWVLETATRDLAGLLAEGRDLQLGVNVSVRHLQAGCLAPDVASALAGAGVPPRRLMIEITESVMLDAEARVASDLATLREMGCIISLDDFGRGWSSLAYLARLPVDVLKMDREFVAGIEGDRRGAALVASVIQLGRTLGMDVVAEGVETPGQLHALRDMGCRFVQGYLLGRPVPLAQLRGALAAFDPAVLGDDASDLDTAVHLVGRQG